MMQVRALSRPSPLAGLAVDARTHHVIHRSRAGGSRGGAAQPTGAGEAGAMGGSRVRAIADAPAAAASGATGVVTADVVQFAVGQLLGSDTSFTALPAVLER